MDDERRVAGREYVKRQIAQADRIAALKRAQMDAGRAAAEAIRDKDLSVRVTNSSTFRVTVIKNRKASR